MMMMMIMVMARCENFRVLCRFCIGIVFSEPCGMKSYNGNFCSLGFESWTQNCPLSIQNIAVMYCLLSDNNLTRIINICSYCTAYHYLYHYTNKKSFS